MASTSGIGMRMWRSMQSWNSVRAAASQAFLDESSAAASGFATAWSNQIAGTATLISKATQKRVATETLAKLNKVKAGLTKVNTVA